jgi:hypothetical protein
MQSTDQSPSQLAKTAIIDAMSLSRGSIFLNQNPGILDALDQDDVVECMFTAAILGHLLMMSEIWKRWGPFPVVYENEEGAEVGRLNGKPFTPIRTRLLPFAPKDGQLRRIFDAIRGYGIQGLIEPGKTYPFLFKEMNLKTPARIQAMKRFKGELPFLDGNCLRWPELAVAIECEAQRTGMFEAYRPMLCWATEDMILQHGPDLAPLRTVQDVVFSVPVGDPSAGSDPLVTRSLAEFKADEQMGDQVVIKKIILGVEPDERHSSSASLLLDSMAPKEVDYGFADAEGRVLCETRADFLLNFQLSPACVENEQQAHVFITKGFPLGILANHIAKVCKEEFAHDLATLQHPTHFSRKTKTDYLSELDGIFIKSLNTDGLGKRLIELFRADQWLSLFKRSPMSYLQPNGLANFRSVHQMDNLGMGIKIDPEDVYDLEAMQYRFRDGTVVVETAEEFNAIVDADVGITCVLLNLDSGRIGWSLKLLEDDGLFNEIIGLHTKVQLMNLWTGIGTEPPHAEQALDDLVRLGGMDIKSFKSMATTAHLSRLGVDVCVQAAKTLEHWNLIARLFRADQLKPYLAIMPRQARGLLIESALGL